MHGYMKDSPSKRLPNFACDFASGTNSTTNTVSELFEDRILHSFLSGKVKEPTLAEFTKAFPEWDLANIFYFLHSEREKDERRESLKEGK